MNENREQIEYWNRAAGWVRYQDDMDAALGVFGEAAIDAARPRAGETILDFGCGCGDTTFALAERAPGGTVVGLDVSGPMLARARARPGQGQGRVGFVRADAAAPPFASGRFDLVYSRFGAMFFADPARAFRALREVGRRLAFVCWRPIEENPWGTAVISALGDLAPPAPPPDPEAPGPYSLAVPARVRSILERAGWGDVALTPFDHVVRYPEQTTWELFMHLGPVARAVATLDDAGKAEARRRLARALGDRIPVLPGAAWVVTATAG